MKEIYHSLRAVSDSVGETKDCAVVAIAAACGVSYKEAHAALAACGRKDRKGTDRDIQHNAVKLLGHRTETLLRRRGLRDSHGNTFPVFNLHHPFLKNAKTFITADRVLRKHYRNRNFLVYVDSHVAAFAGGEIQDHNRCRRRHVEEIYEVI